MKNKQDLSQMWPIISEVIVSGGEFCLHPNGQSMLPLIRPSTDMVTIVAPTELENDDIVLYVRESGQFVLHMLISIKKGKCTMFGDNQKALEHNIPLDKVVAKVKYLHRDGEIIDFNGKDYKKYVKKIHRRINFYRFPVFLSKIKNKIFKKKSTSN